ncbi:beta-ketoacyl-ACP reductase [Thioalkalivibrio denitrificans]|uniref:Beta-ketoacyl-ACP reductase n=1 Tax=Thioalkalivibrio denitrificans TaxID=108003 RepID=A0A1V3NCZ5_9GAMM|nr:acetoacetyl-CoA reductase [Thioalkalivibrio denitrificans]OOG22813.1 beta-ketoacyl-ACP reductase [Thioalkalivibrio denitrificans]
MSRRVALVTGGTGGIGTAICRELTGRGCLVVANYLPELESQAKAWQQEQLADGIEVEIAPGDVSSFEGARAMIEDVEKRIGPVDILVNCAGITRDKTLRKMSEEQWREVMSTNLDSVFNVTRHVIEGMLERGFGRVINISSVNGQKGQFGQCNYASAKAGIHGFTMSLAQEAATKGVTVNSVSPGYVATAMTLAMPDEVREAIVAQVPMRRMGTPEEIAHVVGFLSSSKADYITGANIPVNGGLYMS